MKYNKYIDKLINKNNIYYHFNSYGKRVPDKYNMMLNILSNFISIKRINDEKYTQIKNKLINVTNNYYTKAKLIVGNPSIILTLLTDNSIMNIILTDQNSCYIETYIETNIETYVETYIETNTHSVELLNILIEICKEFGIRKIEMYSNYQSEIDFLLKNGFIVKNQYLLYEL